MNYNNRVILALENHSEWNSNDFSNYVLLFLTISYLLILFFSYHENQVTSGWNLSILKTIFLKYDAPRCTSLGGPLITSSKELCLNNQSSKVMKIKTLSFFKYLARKTWSVTYRQCVTKLVYWSITIHEFTLVSLIWRMRLNGLWVSCFEQRSTQRSSFHM